MAIPDEVLRAALEEYIALGPASRRPAAERLAERLPAAPPEMREAALGAARAAVGAAEKLARECVAGRRTQSLVETELARRFPWLRPAAPGPQGAARTGWGQLLARLRRPEGDLVSRLGHFGYYLIK